MSHGATLASPGGRYSSSRRSTLHGDSTPARGRFHVSGEAPGWVRDVVPQLGRLLDLGVNWSGAPSAPIEPRLAESAVNDVLAHVLPDDGAAIPQVVPCVDGGIQLEWHRGGWDVEVTLSPVGEVWVDASSDDLEWEGEFAARREDLRLLLASIP